MTRRINIHKSLMGGGLRRLLLRPAVLSLSAVLFLPLSLSLAENAKPPVSLPEIIRSGDAEALSKVLKQNRDLANTAITDSGFRPLHLCAGHNHSDMAKALIKAKADLNPTNNAGLTPLHVAAMRGAMETGSELAQRKANLNPRARGGLTPLHLALRGGHEIMVERLVEWGADFDLADDEGVTPLQWAQENSLTNMVAIIQEAAQRRKLFLWVAAQNRSMREWSRTETGPYDSSGDGNVDEDKLDQFREHRAKSRQRQLHSVYLRYLDHAGNEQVTPVIEAAGYRFLAEARLPGRADNIAININTRWQ